jgi:hypothetical protein
MSSIVDNQKRSFQAQAMDNARRLADSLANLSEAQAATIIAVVARESKTPIDIILQGEQGDEVEAYSIADGILPRATGSYSWSTYAGCVFSVELA